MTILASDASLSIRIRNDFSFAFSNEASAWRFFTNVTFSLRTFPFGAGPGGGMSLALAASRPVFNSFARTLSLQEKRRIAAETRKEIRMPNGLIPVTLLEDCTNVRRLQLDSWFSYFACFKATLRFNSNHSNTGEYPV